MFRFVVCLCVVTNFLWPQDAKSCIVTGAVTDAKSGAPIANATLIVYAGKNPTVVDPATDATGRFTIHVDASSQSVSAIAKGYSRVSQYLNCTAAAKTLNFALAPEAVITGRVTDEDGNAVPGARVTLLRPVYVGGERRVIPASGSIAGEDGRFSFDNLANGTYYLLASTGSGGPGAKKTVGPVSIPTLYPSAIEVYAAAPIRIQGPGEIGGSDIRLKRARAFSVRGKLVRPAEGGSLQDYAVTMMPVDFRTFGFFPRHQVITHDEKGIFEFSGVVPGSYNLIAHRMGFATPSARLRVDVADNDVEGVELALNGGIQVKGIVTSEDKEQPPLPAVQIALYPWDVLASTDNTAATVSDQTEFSFNPIRPGSYWVTVTQLPRTAYAKMLRVDDHEAPDWIADLTAMASHKLEIVAGFDAGGVGGLALDASGDPAPRMLVVLVPAGDGPLTGPQYARTYSNEQGRFTFTGVRPGKYKAFAFEKVTAGAFQNRDTLRQFETQAVEVQIEPGMVASANVRVIAASATAGIE